VPLCAVNESELLVKKKRKKKKQVSYTMCLLYRWRMWLKHYMDSPFKFTCSLEFLVCQFISVAFFENSVLFQPWVDTYKTILTYKLIFFSHYCNERAS